MKKRNWKRVLSAVCVLHMIFSGSVVWGAEEQEHPDNSAAQEQFAYMEELADYLSTWTRYAAVNKESLYHGALEAVLTEHPELYEEAMKGMLSSIDENSNYFNPSETEDFFIKAVSGSVTGIGVNVTTMNGRLIVSEPIPDTPAARAGIRAGDALVSADGLEFEGMAMDEALSYVRGAEGTEVEVGIQRSGIDHVIYFRMIREKIVDNPVSFRVYEDGENKAMYIRLYSFNEYASDKVREALDEADKQKITNIIIDVRDNGGGVLEEAIKIAGNFVPADGIITIEDHKTTLLNKTYYSSLKEPKYDLVMLINGNSASASEVLTAAVSENGVAKVIGEKSFGKGTVQSLIQLNQGDSMKYTTAYYLTPNGNNIHKVGIAPDSVVLNEEVPYDSSDIPAFSMSRVYAEGDSGEDVRTAKEILKLFGLYMGETDDVFDANLTSAVSVFQSISGVFSYGVLDKTTQALLRTQLDNGTVTVDRQLEAALAAFAIEIDMGQAENRGE